MTGDHHAWDANPLLARLNTELPPSLPALQALEIMRDLPGFMVDAYNAQVGPEARFDVDAWAAAVAAGAPKELGPNANATKGLSPITAPERLGRVRGLLPCAFCGESEQLEINPGFCDRVVQGEDGSVLFEPDGQTKEETYDAIGCLMCDATAPADVWNGRLSAIMKRRRDGFLRYYTDPIWGRLSRPVEAARTALWTAQAGGDRKAASGARRELARALRSVRDFEPTTHIEAAARADLLQRHREIRAARDWPVAAITTSGVAA